MTAQEPGRERAHPLAASDQNHALFTHDIVQRAVAEPELRERFQICVDDATYAIRASFAAGATWRLPRSSSSTRSRTYSPAAARDTSSALSGWTAIGHEPPYGEVFDIGRSIAPSTHRVDQA